MQEVNKYIDRFDAPTRSERLNMALISLLIELNKKVDKLIPKEAIIQPEASSEPTEASQKPKKKKASK